MEVYRGGPKRVTVCKDVWRIQGRSKKNTRREGKASAKIYDGRGGALRDIRGLRENVGMRTWLHGLMDYAKKAETSISCTGPGRTRKKRYTRSRQAEKVVISWARMATE